MVAHPRKTPSPGPLRPIASETITSGTINPGAHSVQFRSLNLPVPVDVVEDGTERPIAIVLPPSRSLRPARSGRLAQEGRSLAAASLVVTSINDLWQVDDEWWRERPISRRYYQITTQDERRLTVFRDQLDGNWYWQQGG